MKQNKTLILDFEEKYKISRPDRNIIVLSSSYENEWTLDVRKFNKHHVQNVNEFKKGWADFSQGIRADFLETLKNNESVFFRAVIEPLSKWFEAIDNCLDSYNIIEIVFTSYSENSKIFINEGEGEANIQFLYKKYYYLPYYINNYLSSKSSPKITFFNIRNRQTVSFWFALRNILLFIFLNLKTFLFKFLSVKRNYTHSNVEPDFLFSSRGIVQTEFIKNFYLVNKNKSLLIINEQSFRLFKHLNFLKKQKIEFLYAEGCITIKDFINIISSYILKKKSLKSMNLVFNYRSIQINCKDIFPDLFSRELDYLFYSYSVKNIIDRYVSKNLDSKLVTFEMFTSYSYYLKNATKMNICQVQTTLIEPLYSPDFIGSDKFFFTNPFTYNDFKKVNNQLADKMGCIPYLKYIGTKRKKITSSIKQIVYFTQPIDLEEENQIINCVKNYVELKNIKFIIKYHPRQIKTSVQNSSNLTIADKFIDIEKLIKESDVVITRSSSIGLDAWIYGVPTIFVKLNKTLQNQNLFYAPDDYYANATSLSDLTEILDDYTKLVDKFKNHTLYNQMDMNQPKSKNTIFE